MSESSRRGFLKVAGAGVAGAGVAAAVIAQGGESVAAEAAPTAAGLPVSAKREILAHVRDVHSGAMTLMVDGHEIAVHDRDLAARIASVMHQSTARTTV